MPLLSPRRSRPCLGLGLVLLFLGPGLWAEDEASAPRPRLQVFECLQDQVAAAVEQGRLPADAAAAADGLAFDLERELIRKDAEIEVARLEAARFDGDAQQQALDRLVAAVAARERVVIEHVRRLEELAGPSPCTEPAPGTSALAAAPASVTSPESESEPAGDDEPRRKGLGLTIAFEAHDVIEDPDP